MYEFRSDYMLRNKLQVTTNFCLLIWACDCDLAVQNLSWVLLKEPNGILCCLLHTRAPGSLLEIKSATLLLIFYSSFTKSTAIELKTCLALTWVKSRIFNAGIGQVRGKLENEKEMIDFKYLCLPAFYILCEIKVLWQPVKSDDKQCA